ncbi:MAG TPA: tRNA dihydrouridine synthase DusB [Candidatus Omnitrophota bacterium]|nr:tRNA dihydrouridine synthase DusB [Candidatus Omnitrophota bacterium]
MIRLKTLLLKTGVLQSPLAGCSDLAFRVIGREFGMEFAFLEMVSAEALVRRNKQTLSLLKSSPEDHRPLGAQLVGAKPEVMGEAAAMIEAMGFDLLDINLGCPVRKITCSGGGSALLADPEKAEKIFRTVVARVKKIPVTVKMRKGFSDVSGREAVRMTEIAQDCGVSAVTVHGRTRAQGYTGKADWDSIARVKRAVKIPVIGNGDVMNGEDARRLVESTGCDGVMIGRGALGNPWIYRETQKALKGVPPDPEPSFEDRKRVAIRHVEMEFEFEGEVTGFLNSKRIACWYFKYCPGIGQFRNRINRSKSPDEMLCILRDFELCRGKSRI